jgi:hypothetical protein
MSDTKPNSEGYVKTVKDFGIDPERPLLSGLNLTRIDPNAVSHDSGDVRAW